MKVSLHTVDRSLLMLIGLNCLLYLAVVIGWSCGSSVIGVLVLSSDPATLLSTPWTVISYAFTQADLLHLLFNMLWLYAFGRLLLVRRTGRDLMLLYLAGALCGALLYLIFSSPAAGPLIGSSAAVISVAVAVAFIMPDTELYLPLLGMTKVKWIVGVVTLIFLIGLSAPNAGGNLAHLGGVITGATGGLIICRKSAPGSDSRAHTAEYDALKARIRSSGYESLSAKEKRRFFELSSTRSR